MYWIIGFCPNSSPDPFGATLPPGEGILPTAVAVGGCLFLLRLNSFGQLGQVHPPLGLVFQLGFQVGQLLLELL